MAFCRSADGGIGEIYRIAADPHAQGQGIGTALAVPAVRYFKVLERILRVATFEVLTAPSGTEG